MEQRHHVRVALVIPSLIVLYFVYRIFRPFLVPVSVAVVLVSLAYPAFEWLCWRLRGRRGWAALLTCLGLTLIIIVPFVVVLMLVAGQVAQIYDQFQLGLQRGDLKAWFDPQNSRYLGGVWQWLGRRVDLSRIDITGNLTAILRQVSVFFLSHSSAVLSGLFTLVVDFFIMLITMFFLFRDGHRLVEEVKSWTPLSSRYEGRLIRTFREVASATVVGSLVTATAQGVCSGMIYWIVGIPNSLFWGTISAFFSLVPVVGSAIVWLPWALYLLATGSVVKGVIMIALQAVVVGSIDNLLRPLLIEGRAKMHTLVVFFSIMGGMSYFGVLGLVFGPILVALGLTLLELYKTEFRAELSKPAAE